MKAANVGLLLGPSLALVAVLVVALSSVLALSFTLPDGGWSGANYARFLTDSYYRDALLQSLRVAAYCAAACLVIGYPIAYAIGHGSRRFATAAMLVLAVQFFTFYVVKIYGWMLVLGNNGIINRTLIGLGLVDTPVKLMYNELGVAVGLIASGLPLMVFPINSVLQNINRRYEEAALGLGASRLRTLLSITLPLSAPGVVAGTVLVFVFCFTAYLTPALLGGGRFRMIGNVIYEEAMTRFNYPVAATAAGITLLVSLLVILGLNTLGPRLLGARSE